MLVFDMQIYGVRNNWDFFGFGIVMPPPRNFDIGVDCVIPMIKIIRLYVEYFFDIK